MPKRPRSHQLESLSRNRVRQIFEAEGWTVQDLSNDYGEDMFVRVFEDGVATPLSFFVQAKSTDSMRASSPQRGSISVCVSVGHLVHWEQFREPVILTLWASQANVTYWTCIQDAISELPKGFRGQKTVNIPISRSSVLDAHGLGEICQLAKNRHSALDREAKGSDVLIGLLEQKLQAKIEYTSKGVLLVKDRKGAKECLFFGDTGSLLCKLASTLGKTPEETLHRALESAAEDLAEFERSGYYPVLDRRSGHRQLKKLTREQLKRLILEELRN